MCQGSLVFIREQSDRTGLCMRTVACCHACIRPVTTFPGGRFGMIIDEGKDINSADVRFDCRRGLRVVLGPVHVEGVHKVKVLKDFNLLGVCFSETKV